MPGQIAHCPTCQKRSSVSVDVPDDASTCADCGTKLILLVETHLLENEERIAPAEEVGTSAEIACADQDTETFDPQAVSKEARPSSKLPEMAGRYRIEKEIARGGMGQVFRAYDPDFQRSLAIKMMLTRSSQDAAAERRFLEEARITGRLQHPGIPPIHELGKLPDGRPFFAMKLIAGETLARLLKQRKNPNDDLPRYLNIFAQVCQALGFAHSLEIIHRDLKPANIMVGAFGEVQVMDWGLAKVMSDSEPNMSPDDGIRSPESALLTKAGTIMGTPAYMAPEQARGEIDALDTRCDVFGLGAILIEILTGKPVYADANSHELIKRAMQGDLSDALDRLSSCGCDDALVKLVKHCLAPSKDDRPRHAGEIAKTIEDYQDRAQERLRHAELERAEARVQAEEERKRRQIEQDKLSEERRRRRLTLVLAAVLVMFVSGAGAVAWWYRDVQAKRDMQAQLLNESVATALDECEQQRREQIETLADESGARELLNDLRKWQYRLENAQSRLRNAQSLAEGNPQLLDSALKDRMRQLAAKLKSDTDDFELAAQLDRIRLEAHTTAGQHVEVSSAAPKYLLAFQKADLDFRNEKAKDLAQQIREMPNRYSLIAALDHGWSSAAGFTKDEALIRKIIEVVRLADPDPWRNRFRDYDRLQDLKHMETLAADLIAAEQSPHIIAALALRLSFLDGDPNQVLQPALVQYPQDFWFYFLLGEIKNDSRTREGYYRAALAQRPRSDAVHLNLGRILFDQGKKNAAEAHTLKALEYNPKMVLAHCNFAHMKNVEGNNLIAVEHLRKALAIDPNYAHAHNGLGHVLRELDDLKGAAEHFKKAINCDENFASPHFNLALILEDQGEIDSAIDHYKKAIEIRPKHFQAHTNLASILSARGDSKNAMAHYEKVMEIQPTPEIQFNMGVLLLQAGQLQEGAVHVRKALKLNPKFTQAWHTLGIVENALGNSSEAVRCFEKAIEIDAKFTSSRVDLASIFIDRNDLAGARSHLEQALEFAPNSIAALNALGTVYRRQRELNRAVEVYNRALKLNANDFQVLTNLGNALTELEKEDEALAAFERAIELRPNHPSIAYSLGLALNHFGRHEKAVVHLKNSIQLQPGFAHAHYQLALALRKRGDFKKALESMQRAHELGSKAPGWAYPSKDHLERYKRILELSHVESREPVELASAAAGIKGELNESAPLDIHQAKEKRYRQSVVVNLKAGAHYQLDATGEFQALLYIEDLMFNTLLASCDAPKTPRSQLVFTPPHDGAYRIAVTSRNEGGTGDYTIRLRKARKLNEPTMITGELSGDSKPGATRKQHKVSLVEGKCYTIQVVSHDFQPQVELLGTKGNVILASSSGFARSNPKTQRIAYTPAQTAEYVIQVTSDQEEKTGEYVLQVQGFEPIEASMRD